MLVCDVEMGATSTQRRARSEIDPEGGVPIPGSGSDALSSWFASALGDAPPDAFDSVSVTPSAIGVRVPEYVVYNPSQAVPRFLLAVEQVPKGEAEELLDGSGAAWLRAKRDAERARTQEEAQRHDWWQRLAEADGELGEGDGDGDNNGHSDDNGSGGTSTHSGGVGGGGGGVGSGVWNGLGSSSALPFLLHGGTRAPHAPGRPMCRYGQACYRRSLAHWEEYDHPPSHPAFDVAREEDATALPAPLALPPPKIASTVALDPALCAGAGVVVEKARTHAWLGRSWVRKRLLLDVERACLVFYDVPPAEAADVGDEEGGGAGSTEAHNKKLYKAIPLEEIESVEAVDAPSSAMGRLVARFGSTASLELRLWTDEARCATKSMLLRVDPLAVFTLGAMPCEPPSAGGGASGGPLGGQSSVGAVPTAGEACNYWRDVIVRNVQASRLRLPGRLVQREAAAAGQGREPSRLHATATGGREGSWRSAASYKERATLSKAEVRRHGPLFPSVPHTDTCPRV